MAKINEVHSVIVPANAANLTAHTYSELYGGPSGCSIVLNGLTMNMGGASSIYININSVSGGTGCYLLGVNKDVILGSTSFK
jgi:hypothetical protein